MTVCHATSIVLDGGHLEYFGPQGASWRIPVAAIKIIGEYTSAGAGDGNCLAFVIAADGQWFQARLAAAGLERVLPALCRRLGTALTPGLANPATPGGRILWQQQLAGRPLFESAAKSSPGKQRPAHRPALHESVIGHLRGEAASRSG